MQVDEIAQDYALLLGMPGTGKSSTIACLVEHLVRLGKTVLITSYTHTALDHLLLKIRDLNVDFLRLGNTNKMHPEIRQQVEEQLQSVTSIAQLKELFMSKRVVGTTCLGVQQYSFQLTLVLCLQHDSLTMSL